MVVDAITRITILVHEEAVTKPSWDDSKLIPDSKETADHSFPFCVAVALVAGEVTPEHFTDEWLWDSQVRRLMQVTELRVDDALTKVFRNGGRPAAVRVDVGEASYFREVLFPLGSPEDPMQDSDVEAKFLALSRSSLSDEHAQQVIRATRALQLEGNVSQYVRLLAR